MSLEGLMPRTNGTDDETSYDELGLIKLAKLGKIRPDFADEKFNSLANTLQRKYAKWETPLSMHMIWALRRILILMFCLKSLPRDLPTEHKTSKLRY
jgi:hypothetical protein